MNGKKARMLRKWAREACPTPSITEPELVPHPRDGVARGVVRWNPRSYRSAYSDLKAAYKSLRGEL